MKLGDLLAKAASDNPSNVAVIYRGQKTTYGRLIKNVNRFANGLLKLGMFCGILAFYFGPRGL